MEETVNDLVQTIKGIVEGVEKDAEKCDNGNRQAGIRVRKAMLDVINLGKDTRKKVIEVRK
jgi:hypothetical protein